MWWSGLVTIPLAIFFNYWLSRLDQKALGIEFINNKDKEKERKKDNKNQSDHKEEEKQDEVR